VRQALRLLRRRRQLLDQLLRAIARAVKKR
jgi:hypothetical protein